MMQTKYNNLNILSATKWTTGQNLMNLKNKGTSLVR